MKRLKSALRFFAALAFLPACWGLTRVFIDSIAFAAEKGDGFSAETLSLVGGIAAFVVTWAVLSRPVRAYVLAHELTHAMWGALFGAKASNLQVGEKGGSVKLTKSNMLITLAPYFFPFYTFLVIIAALVTYAFLRPLPWLPLWMFAIGFTWSFHVLFTLETLSGKQPDITLYGRMFSWTFIYMANIAVVLLFLCCTTNLGFSDLAAFFVKRVLSAYSTTFGYVYDGINYVIERFR